MKRIPVFHLICASILSAAAPVAAQVISLSPARTAEGNSGSVQVTVPVYLSPAQPGPITVNWATANDTATAGTDYTAASGTVTFAAGEVYKTLSVTVTGDTIHEQDETFRILLSNPSTPATLGDGETRIRIHNDEIPTVVALPGATTIFEKPVAEATVLNAAVLHPVAGRTLPLALETGTAAPGTDVRLLNAKIQLSVPNPQVPVLAVDDTLEEPDESFAVTGVPSGPEVRLLPQSERQQFSVGADFMDLKLSGDVAAVVNDRMLRIYRKSANAWAQEFTVGLPNGGTQSITVDGNTVAADIPSQGVFLYQYSDGAWAEMAFLPQNINTVERDRRLALSDDLLAVSDPSASATVSGEVRIYERHFGGRNAWGLSRTIRPAATRTDFGYSVSAWGPFLAVGAPETSYGCLYLWNATARNWSVVLEHTGLFYTVGHSCFVNGNMVVFSSNGQTVVSRRANPSGTLWGTVEGPWYHGYSREGLDGSLFYSYHSNLDGLHIMTHNSGGQFDYRTISTRGVQLLQISGQNAAAARLNQQGSVDIIFSEGGSVSGTLVDDDRVTFTAGSTVVVEGNQVTIPVSISSKLPVAASVFCMTADGTATAGDDYEWTSSWVTFNPGQEVSYITVTALTDGVTEGAETVQIQLLYPSFGKVAPAGVLTITDRAPPTATLAQTSYTVVEGSSATPGSVTLSVNIASAAPAGAGFDWAITPGTATAGQDYPNATGSASIPAGVTTATFSIPLTGDDVCEPAENFSVQLSNFRNLTAGSNLNAAVTIQNDDNGTPQPDSYTTAQNTPLTANVRSNDCSTLTTTLATTVSGGTLTYSASGAFTYTPRPNFIGTDNFSYNGGGSSGSGSGGAVEFVGPTSLFRWYNPMDGVDPAALFTGWNAGWFTAEWNDASWGNGSGLMGYGLIQSARGQLEPDTNIGTPPSGQRRTAYFRHKFNVAEAGVYDLELSISRDDAAIIYINGAEVLRSHEAGAVQIATAPDTWDLMVEGNSAAWTATNNEGEPYTHAISGVTLGAGLNTLAISAHNSLGGGAPTSSDLAIKVFHLRGQSAGAPPPPVPVTIQVTDAQLPPVLTSDAYTGTEDIILNTGSAALPSLYANDGLHNASGAAYDPILEIAVQDATGGTVTSINSATGHFIFTPAPEFSGAASFRYRVRDKDGWSASANVAISIADDFTLQQPARLDPPGSLLFGSSTGYQFSSAGVMLDGAIVLKAGQTLSMRTALNVPPPGILRLETAAGAVVPGGQPRLFGIDGIPIPADGTYMIRLGQPGTQLTGTLTLLVNGGLPDFVESGALYDLAGTAPAVLPRGAVQATLFSELPHRYALPASAGVPLRFFIHSSGGAVPFRIEDNAGTAQATSITLPAGSDSTMIAWTPPNAGPYRLVVPGIPGRTYTLQSYSGADTFEKITDASLPVPARGAGHISGSGGVETGVTFAVFGDYGSGNANELAVANMVKSWNPDFLLPVGDHNYSNDWTVGSAVWTQRVGNFYGSYILRRADNRYPEQTSLIQRFFPVPGNHDSGPSTANGGDLSAYLEYLHHNPGGTPRLPAGVHENTKSYYKFTWGDMEFYMIDADNAVVDPALASEQRLWLKSQLATSTARWKFAAWHQPAYSSSAVHGNHPAMQWGADWTGLTAIFTGHDHTYERLNVGHGVTQFVSGLGGASIYQFGAPKPESRFRYNANYGSMRVRAGSSGVLFEFLAVGIPGGTVIDTYTIGTPPGQNVANGTDTWTLRVQPGRTYRLSTTTPAAPGTLTNTLNPALEVRTHEDTLAASDLSSAADGINASLQFTVPIIPNCPPEGCAWTVRLYNETSGSGEYLLHITEEPGPVDDYNTWAATSLPPDQRDFAADPDLDGAPNLMEYLASTAPGKPGAAPLAIASDGSLTLALPASWEKPVRVILQSSSTLAPGAWSDIATRNGSSAWSGAGPLPVSAPGGGFVLTAAPDSRKFYRLLFKLGG